MEDKQENKKKILAKLEGKPDYEAGFDILMEYWDSLPDEAKVDIDKQLKEVGC